MISSSHLFLLQKNEADDTCWNDVTLWGAFGRLGLSFAGLTLASLPMILLFFIASKQFMEGLTAGAIK